MKYPSGTKNYQWNDTNQTPKSWLTLLQTSIYGSLILEIQMLEFCNLQGSVVGFSLKTLLVDLALYEVKRAFVLGGWRWVRKSGCNSLFCYFYQYSYLSFPPYSCVSLNIVLMYAFVWSIYIWSYIVYSDRSLCFDGIMLMWLYRCSLKWDKWGSSGEILSNGKGNKEGAKRKT